MDMPFGANPRLKGVNLEKHELKTIGPRTCQIEEIQGPSSPESSVDNSSVQIRDSIMTRSIDSNGSTNGRLVTMTGTIKRGLKLGETVEVQLQLSEDELDKLQQSYIEEAKEDEACLCGLKKGIHIVLFTIIFIPFAMIASIVMAFYIGTIAWYNVYLNLSEERTVWHKICFCPILILTFPIFIVVTAVLIGIYASLIQISWYLTRWQKEVLDFEKGFYGWVCHKLGVPQCAPYEVVILDEPNLPDNSQTSTKNASDGE